MSLHQQNGFLYREILTLHIIPISSGIIMYLSNIHTGHFMLKSRPILVLPVQPNEHKIFCCKNIFNNCFQNVACSHEAVLQNSSSLSSPQSSLPSHRPEEIQTPLLHQNWELEHRAAEIRTRLIALIVHS